jgi:hypothetical protein
MMTNFWGSYSWLVWTRRSLEPQKLVIMEEKTCYPSDMVHITFSSMMTNFWGSRDRLVHTNQLYYSSHLARVLPLNHHGRKDLLPFRYGTYHLTLYLFMQQCD